MTLYFDKKYEELSKRNTLTDKCIVLDLDHTLISTQDDENLENLISFKILSDSKYLAYRSRVYVLTIEDYDIAGSGSQYKFWGVVRPYVREFLTFCFQYFKIVTVWSAGKRKYVESVVDFLFKDLPKPDIIFTYDDIIETIDNNTSKPLTKMYSCHECMNCYNTIILDDNVLTFEENVNNGVLIPRYHPSVEEIENMNDNDNELEKLIKWLMSPEVIYNTDFQQLNKDNIFV